MNKKGFTLPEMLVVLVFICILLLITFPNISSLMKKTDENKIKAFENDLFLASEAYIQKNIDKCPDLQNTNGICEIKVSQLIASKFVRSNLIDPNTGEEISKSNYIVKITNDEDSGYSFELK